MQHHLPQQLLHDLEGLPGFDEQSFIDVHTSKEQVTSVRLNPAKPITADHFAGSEQVPWCEYGRYLPARPSFTLDPVFHGGAYYVQEASSMFLHHVIRQVYTDEQPRHVLDLCGAPGGKSTLVAAALPNSFIVSNEVIKTRVSVLAENISKWGSEHVVVTNNDPKDFTRLPAFFDLMVVDAPCSGSGLFRKDPAAIEEWSENNVQMCSLRQQRILTDAIPSLRRDGYLIYSTCSYSKQENEDICDWIVDTFRLTPVAVATEPGWGVTETISPVHGASGYRFYPDKVKGEGLFIACFRQENPVEEYYAPANKLQLLTRNEQEQVNSWLQEPEASTLFVQKENIVAIPARWAESFAIVQKNLSVRKSGVAIGNFKGKDLIPHHEFALSSLLHQHIVVADLDKEEALRYLKRQDLVLSTAQKGWSLMRHQGINLGWAKVLPTRVNNYYPTNWRILIP
ncbi:methyltransferase RsmF C-terminal domain-like protein [Aridibaculum aurantiacum]|uniref:methyltransferase RsmF C-terminal domain-like protein n=1 Tax=Aridibaculum aurantiacum TaxID=2810307 RepID=UPI001A977A35|nr:RsmB/NOP family class I SAM-dependent RNA methyltransferase [Aridibaculum aurantiacum]